MSDMPQADRPAAGRTARRRAPAAPPTSLRQGYGGPPKHPRRRKPGRRDGGRLDVRVSDERGRAVRAAGLGSWLARLAPARARGLVSVALVSDRRVRALNRTYRRQDYSTDVLSFPAFARMDNARASARQARRPVRPQETRASARQARRPVRPQETRVSARQTVGSTPTVPSPCVGEPPVRSRQSPAPSPFLGDIVISRGVARRQAREAGHSELTELRVLALHGLLHLLGYDHDRDNGRMRRIERRLRRKGGLREGLIERASR